MLDDFDAALMMIMVDEKHWAKLCYEYSSKKPMIVSVVTAAFQMTATLAVPKTGIHLRITRFGHCFAFHYSHDAQWWEMVRYFRLEAAGPIKVGLVAQSPTGSGCQVTFSHLSFSPIPVTDIRSGK